MRLAFFIFYIFFSDFLVAQVYNPPGQDTLWAFVNEEEKAWFQQPLAFSDFDSVTAQIHFSEIRESLSTTEHMDDHYVICYRVKRKENLFRISRIYFNMQIEEVVRLNQLPNRRLDINQVLVIGHLPLSFFTDEMAHNQFDTLGIYTDSTSGNPGARIMRSPIDEYEENGTLVHKGKGVAFWDKKAEEENRYFVLHPLAKPNSLIEIVNPMNDRKVFAKVVGRIPQKAYTSDIQIVVSPAVARKLGVLDSRFYTTYRYIR